MKAACPGGAADRAAAANASALHNMSAPPRSVVDLRPLRAAGALRRDASSTETVPGTGNDASSTGAAHESRTDASSAGAAPDGPLPGPTGTLYARVHLTGLLFLGRPEEPCGRDIAIEPYGDDGVPRDLLDAVALLRAGAWARRAVEAARSGCRGMPASALHREFVDRIDALGPMGLPSLLLVRPADPRIVPRCAPLAPLAALRLLAGTVGGLFLRARRPGAGLFYTGAPGASTGYPDFDYYLPLNVRAPGGEPGGE